MCACVQKTLNIFLGCMFPRGQLAPIVKAGFALFFCFLFNDAFSVQCESSNSSVLLKLSMRSDGILSNVHGGQNTDVKQWMEFTNSKSCVCVHVWSYLSRGSRASKCFLCWTSQYKYRRLSSFLIIHPLWLSLIPLTSAQSSVQHSSFSQFHTKCLENVWRNNFSNCLRIMNGHLRNCLTHQVFLTAT